MYNLEDIKLHQVSDNKGVRFIDYIKTLKPNYTIVWRDIILGYALLISTLAIFISIEKKGSVSSLNLFFLSILFAFLAAFWLSFIQLFIHEAAHFNIHPDKKKNDSLANLFIGLILGVDIESYRKTHWKHHLRLGHPDDTENSYFNPLDIPFIASTLTGIHAFIILKNRKKLENAQTEDTIKKQTKSFYLGLLLNIVFLAILLYNNLYFSCFMWVLTVFVFYPFFASIRQLLEHRDTKYTGLKLKFFDKDHGKVSRMFKPGILSFFMGGAGFDRHMIHHWVPSVSYTNLKEVEDFLLNSDTCKDIVQNSKSTYLQTFLNLIEV